MDCLSVGVRRLPVLLVLILVHAAAGSASAQTKTAVVITSPADGAILQGPIEIRGTVTGPEFVSADLAFSYAPNPTDTWFTIAEFTQPVTEGVLGELDSTSISDGAYALRLRLTMADGSSQETIVGVEVRNYTSSPGVTPSAVPTSAPLVHVATPVLVLESPTPVRALPLTPASLPPNEAALSTGQVLKGFAQGGLAILALFLLVGVLLIRRRP